MLAGSQSSLIFSGEPLMYILKLESVRFLTMTLILCNLEENSNLLTIPMSLFCEGEELGFLTEAII